MTVSSNKNSILKKFEFEKFKQGLQNLNFSKKQCYLIIASFFIAFFPLILVLFFQQNESKLLIIIACLNYFAWFNFISCIAWFSLQKENKDLDHFLYNDSQSVDQKIFYLFRYILKKLPLVSIGVKLQDSASNLLIKEFFIVNSNSGDKPPKTLHNDSLNNKIIIKEIRNNQLSYGELELTYNEFLNPNFLEYYEQILEFLQKTILQILTQGEYQTELTRMRLYNESTQKAKTGFLANLSHELRSPLGSIINAVELNLDEVCGPITELQRETLEIVKSSSGHLLDLVNDVIDYAKSEAGQLTPQPTRFDLVEELYDICKIMSFQAEQKKQKLIFPEDKTPQFINFDKRHFRQIFINLLSNAVKYTPESGQLAVLVTRVKDEQIKVTVRDNGEGIPKEEQKKIFQPFERVSSDYSKTQTGAGLGLALTKNLVNVNNASIGFTSEFKKGSDFFVIFQLAQALETSIEPNVSKQNESKKTPLSTTELTITELILENPTIVLNEEASLNDSQLETTLEPAQNNSSKEDRSIKVLDEKTIEELAAKKIIFVMQKNQQVIFESYFSAIGIKNIKYCHSYLEAKKLINDELQVDGSPNVLSYDFCIIDTGKEILIDEAELSYLKSNSRILILLTAQAFEFGIEDSLQKSVDYCLIKPFSLVDLKNIILHLSQ